MSEYTDIQLFCWTCRGTGEKPTAQGETIPCPACGGDGKILRSHLNVTELNTKLNSIIDEQAAQRTDLTAALTQIWNKVKDL